MPTIVRNEAGMRPCERALQAAFRAEHAGPYPANTRMDVFRDGGRAARIVAALAADGVVEALDPRPNDPRNIALEVFPHAAHVRLFGRDRIFKYKRKTGRLGFLDEWAAYRAQLAALAAADPPLVLDASIPEHVPARGYKRWDDTLDAITCAYVAAVVHRWGRAGVDVFGDLTDGYIVVPKPCVWARARTVTRAR
jgi:predicted RNase H-like nuclease